MRRSHALIKAHQAWRVNGWVVYRSGLSPGVLTLPYPVTCKGLCTGCLCVRTLSLSANPALSVTCTGLCTAVSLFVKDSSCCTVSASFCDVLWVLCTLPGVWCQCVGVSSLEISLLCHLYSWEILYWLLKSLWHIPIWLPSELHLTAWGWGVFFP